jgi:hypothetical protein
MEFRATSPAAYWLSPFANSFHTSTIAMQRASPIIMTPTMNSGYDRRNMIASANINTGPMSQF